MHRSRLVYFYSPTRAIVKAQQEPDTNTGVRLQVSYIIIELKSENGCISAQLRCACVRDEDYRNAKLLLTRYFDDFYITLSAIKEQQVLIEESSVELDVSLSSV